MKRMTAAVQQQLLDLNRAFYTQVAPEFDRTRAGLPAGWQMLFHYLPTANPNDVLHVLDVGCGNGRFARALEQQQGAFQYVGVDATSVLLALAAQQTADLVRTPVHFVQADVAQPGWSARVRQQHYPYDVIVCLAMLHHLPGYGLRLRVVEELASLLAPAGVLILSNWQFLTSERFVQKQIPWTTIGLTAEDVEPGDALLPWQPSGYAVRYVHQVAEAEMAQLAQAAGLRVTATFFADGKEGNLNLYAVCR
jgi:tRNA (uracil-5-)-methyltransferase TRM9